MRLEFKEWGGTNHLKKFQDAMRGLKNQYEKVSKLKDSENTLSKFREQYNEKLSQAEKTSGLSKS